MLSACCGMCVEVLIDLSCNSKATQYSTMWCSACLEVVGLGAVVSTWNFASHSGRQWHLIVMMSSGTCSCRSMTVSCTAGILGKLITAEIMFSSLQYAGL
jgi:hypothetical protein